MALTANLTVGIRLMGQQTNEVTFGEDGIGRIDEARGPTFTSGTGANNINVMYSATRTIAAGANESLNVHNASLYNAIGNTVAMDALKNIYVKNTSTALTLSIGGSATGVRLVSDPTTVTLDIPPGGELTMSAPNATGWAVTTNDILRFAASAGSGDLSYYLAIAGVDS